MPRRRPRHSSAIPKRNSNCAISIDKCWMRFGKGTWITHWTKRSRKPSAVKELDVQWLNATSVHADRSLTMQLRVTEAGAAVGRRSPDIPLRPAGRGAVLYASGDGRGWRCRDQD